MRIWQKIAIFDPDRNAKSGNSYSEEVLLEVVLRAGVGLGLSAAVPLEGFEGFYVIILHEIFMEDADEALLLLRGGV